MDIKQSRHGTRTHFAFGEHALDYTHEDGSGSRSFSVPYTEISRDRQTLEVRNQWLRNVGILWLILGAGLTVFTWTGENPRPPSIWVYVGAVCYAIYWFRRTKFTIVPTDRGNIFVIDDQDGPRIVQEIESRRVGQLRAEYDFANDDESPEQQANRYKWLHGQGALTADELRQRLDLLERPVETQSAGLPSGHLLN